MGLIMPIIDIIVMTVIQTTVPLDKMGRVSSILNTLMMVASPLGAILAGPLSVILGVSSLYFFCAVVSIIVTIIPYFFTGIRHIDYDQPIIDSMWYPVNIRKLDYGNSGKNIRNWCKNKEFEEKILIFCLFVFIEV